MCAVGESGEVPGDVWKGDGEGGAGVRRKGRSWCGRVCKLCKDSLVALGMLDMYILLIILHFMKLPFNVSRRRSWPLFD